VKKTSHIHGTPYLTKDKSPVSEGEEHHVKNEDEIDESHVCAVVGARLYVG